LQWSFGEVIVAADIVMPRLSDSMEEGTIVRWLVEVGDEIAEGTPLAEIETDKATAVYEADETGTVLALTVGEGETVSVGLPIAVIGAVNEATAPAARPAAAPSAFARRAVVRPAVARSAVTKQAATAAPRRARQQRAKASPLARRLAAEHGIDLGGLTGSGPEGRVIRADVEQALAAAGNGASSAMQELTNLQRTVARRMAESRATVPDLELRVEVDMSSVLGLRDELRDLANPVPTINDFIVKACALALREFPKVNGSYRDSRLETHSRVNVGIAVAAEDALMVPIVVDADAKSVVEISRAARLLAARVREGSIAPAELSGGTFTVSNLGMYGIDSFSAVINPPQAAILAVGAARRRPVVDQDSGAVVARPTVVLSLACDHRIVYGAEGSRFLARVRELLERPLALLL
jgi:pyruvate dehydrogenase E2 component (dihydrolipoamide acetyltransferase)